MGTKKIVLVEDELSLREILAEKLSEAGFSVRAAGNGLEAIALIRKEKPDLVITDVLMPEMDGNTLLKEMRNSTFGRDIPFIVITARVKMKDYFEVVGVNAFIEKPFKMEDLTASVKKILALPEDQAVQKEPASSGKQIDISAGLGSVIAAAEMTAKGDISPEDVRTSPGMAPGARPAKTSSGKTRSKKKLMIVEDHKLVVAELNKILAEYDYEIKTVKEPGDCLKEIIYFSPNLIISKMYFGNMNADMMANIIKEMPRFRDVPILIYKKIGNFVEDKNAQEEGLQRFVLDAEGFELLKKINQLMGSSQ